MLEAPELKGDDADQYIVIDEHITYRLAQRPSSYVVLKYIQAVIKHKGTQIITTKSAPVPVFEKSMADVSFKPVTDAFFQWCQQQASRVDILPKSLFAKAIQYARNHETELKVFLSDANVPMDTGAVEHDLRVIPMGKKNWLFNWTEVGAEYTGIIQSLIVSCRMQGINPNIYLTDVL